MSGITIRGKYCISKEIIHLLNKEVYEPFVLGIMNKSCNIFRGHYSENKEQSNGECDFVDDVTGEKYDAKLPLCREQVALLTDGKKHSPLICEWLEGLRDETSFDPMAYRELRAKYIETKKLYQVIKYQIEKSQPDENLVFFLPYPITNCFKGSFFLQFASDYLDVIFDCLKDNNLVKKDLFAIYPSGDKNQFVVQKLGSCVKEYLEDSSIEKYITHEIVGCSVK